MKFFKKIINYIFLFALLFANLAYAADYLIYKGDWQAPTENEHAAAYKILNTYQFPMSLSLDNEQAIKALSSQELDELSADEAGFLQKKIKEVNPDLKIAFIPTTLYEVFCVYCFIEELTNFDFKKDNLTIPFFKLTSADKINEYSSKFLQFLHKNMNEKILFFLKHKKITSINPDNSVKIARELIDRGNELYKKVPDLFNGYKYEINFWVNCNPFEFKPDLEKSIVEKSINVDFIAAREGKHTLYRGTDGYVLPGTFDKVLDGIKLGKKEATLPVGASVIQGLSYGNSLCAGSMWQGGAGESSALFSMAGSGFPAKRYGYAFLVDKKSFYKKIPRSEYDFFAMKACGTIYNLVQGGEFFHPRAFLSAEDLESKEKTVIFQNLLLQNAYIVKGNFPKYKSPIKAEKSLFDVESNTADMPDPSASNNNYKDDATEKRKLFVQDCKMLDPLNKRIAEKTDDVVRIATYNVHYWSGSGVESFGSPEPSIDKSAIAVIKVINADILILQEIGGKYKQTYEKMLDEFGYKYRFVEGSLLIASRYLFKNSRSVIYESSDGEPRYFLNVKITLPNKQELSVYGTHLAVSDLDGKIRRAEIEQLGEEIKKDNSTNILVAGDFNETREQDYSPKMWGDLKKNNLTRGDKTSTGVFEYLNSNSFVDCFTYANLEYPTFTVWSGTAVDFIYLKKQAWNLPLAGCYMYFSSESDHLPIFMDALLIDPKSSDFEKIIQKKKEVQKIQQQKREAELKKILDEAAKKREEEARRREEEAKKHLEEQKEFEQKAVMTTEEAEKILKPIIAFEQKFGEFKKKVEEKIKTLTEEPNRRRYNRAIFLFEDLFELAKNNVKVAKLFPEVYQKFLPEMINNLLNQSEKYLENINYMYKYEETNQQYFKFIDNNFYVFKDAFNNNVSGYEYAAFANDLKGVTFLWYFIKQKLELFYQTAKLAVENNCEKADIVNKFLGELLKTRN